MDIGLVTSVVSIPVVGALGAAAWRVQVAVTARKQAEIDSLKTDIESMKNLHGEQMTIMKEKNDLSNDQLEQLVSNRANEIGSRISAEYTSQIRSWKSRGLVGITAAVGLAIFVFGFLVSLFPRTASVDELVTVVNKEGTAEVMSKFGFTNDTVVGTVIFSHGPTLMWSTIIGATVLTIALAFVAANAFVKLKTPDQAPVETSNTSSENTAEAEKEESKIT
ncbi:MAG: hypothetical protein VX359_05840 [Chloroflexota bacterium]